MRIPQILGNDTHASTVVPRPFFLRPGYEARVLYTRSAAAGIRSRAARCLLAPKHGLAALSLCLHSSFLVCVLFLVSDNNSDEFGCCRWSLRTPGASLLVGREKGSQINQNHNIGLSHSMQNPAPLSIRMRRNWPRVSRPRV